MFYLTFLCSALSGLKTSLPFTQGVALGWYVAALSGLKTSLPFTQGVALGWYVAALSGLRKIKSFWELAILVTLN